MTRGRLVGSLYQTIYNMICIRISSICASLLEREVTICMYRSIGQFLWSVAASAAFFTGFWSLEDEFVVIVGSVKVLYRNLVRKCLTG